MIFRMGPSPRSRCALHLAVHEAASIRSSDARIQRAAHVAPRPRLTLSRAAASCSQRCNAWCAQQAIESCTIRNTLLAGAQMRCGAHVPQVGSQYGGSDLKQCVVFAAKNIDSYYVTKVHGGAPDCAHARRAEDA